MMKAEPPRILKYVKGAIGETDVPDSLSEFIGQRRRWLNGSFFAATYAIAHTGQVLRSGHSFSRKIFLMIEMVYNVINLVFSWFSIVSGNHGFFSLSSDSHHHRETFIYSSYAVHIYRI
jgi:chitin synthase